MQFLLTFFSVKFEWPRASWNTAVANFAFKSYAMIGGGRFVRTVVVVVFVVFVLIAGFFGVACGLVFADTFAIAASSASA